MSFPIKTLLSKKQTGDKKESSTIFFTQTGDKKESSTIFIMPKLKDQPRRCAFWELVHNWYKYFPRDYSAQVEMNN